MRQSMLLVTAALLSAQDPAPATPTAATALGDSGLRMQLPPGFTAAAKPPVGVLFTAMQPPQDGFRANLNVTAGPVALPAQLDVAAIRQDLVTSYEKLFHDYAFVDDGTMPVLGRPAYWISSRFRQGKLLLRNFQVLVPAGKPCWCTYTLRDDDYEAQLPALRAALATLQQDVDAAPPQAAPAFHLDGDQVVIEQPRLRFTPPRGWRPTTAPPGYLLQCRAKAAHGFAANVLLAAAPAAKTLDARAVQQQFEQELRALWKEVGIDRTSQLTIAGSKALLLQASCQSPGGRLTVFQCHVPAEPQSFVLTYIVLAASAAQLRPLIEASAASLAIDAAPAGTGR